jgi:molybdenum cofactor synthesis domain-containing protein
MDGIAVRAADIAPASKVKPVRLLLGEGAIEIDTGGALPDGFDAVIPIERVKRSGKSVVVDAPVPAGKNVRLPGEDVPPGVAIGWPGFGLRPLDCAALVATGCTTVEVVKRAKLAVIPTGDEIVLSGTPSKPGTVVESNSIMIAAEARTLGASVRVWPIVKDDLRSIEAALREALAESDVVALLAGSSRGRRDHGAAAIAAAGDVDVHGVATRPGKPVVLGHAGSVPMVNLPGYPVSCHFAFETYVAPLLRRLGGLADPLARRARLSDAVSVDGSADEWHTATLLTAPGSPRAIVVPQNEVGGGLYRLTQADARYHLKRGVADFGRHVAVPWTPLRDADSAARSLFVGPYDPLIEELAALGGFRCRWTGDESGAALDEGIADAVGVLVRAGEYDVLRKRAAAGRKVLPIGLRREGVAVSAAPATVAITGDESDDDPWARVAAVACGIRRSAPCALYIAQRFGVGFEEGPPALYAIVWEDRPGHRFPWGIVLAAALSALEDAGSKLGWKSIGISEEAIR